MRISREVEYLALSCFAACICLLPRKAALFIGSAIGRLGWALGIRRELVLSNIAKARPEARRDELKSIGQSAAMNFGKTAVEFIRFRGRDRQQIKELVSVEGIEYLRSALQKGKGAILLTAHFGAWALYFAAIATRGVKLSLLVGKQHNDKVDRFIHGISGSDVELISKGRSAVRTILQRLQKGHAVVVVADQHAGEGGLPVPFLGETASTLPLPASFAVKYSVPTLTIMGQRVEKGRHLARIAPLQYTQPESEKKQKYEILAQYNQEIGKIVSKYPEQYFWYHRRWREPSQ